jgi:hypothetical protein
MAGNRNKNKFNGSIVPTEPKDFNEFLASDETLSPEQEDSLLNAILEETNSQDTPQFVGFRVRLSYTAYTTMTAFNKEVGLEPSETVELLVGLLDSLTPDMIETVLRARFEAQMQEMKNRLHTKNL